MSLIENCDLMKNFATVFKICIKKEEKMKCLDMMKETYDAIHKLCLNTIGNTGREKK